MQNTDEGGYVVFDHVSKDYRGFQALKDVSFEIGKGEILGYVGPNGAGKTTTIKAMVGLISDFHGRIRIAGRELPGDRRDVHRLVGYLPQSVAFQEWRTVDHALSTFGVLSGVPREDLELRITEALQAVGLSEQRGRKIIELSGGNVQKVGLAQALLHKPSFLILDEPLGGLDPMSRHNIKQIIKGLSASGITVFFSSHILSDVQDLATRVAILNRGRLIKIGTIDELKSEFAAPNVITIEFSSGQAAPDIASGAGILSVEALGGKCMRVSISPEMDADAVSNRLLAEMLASGHRVRSFGSMNPNLDELYLKYVGRGVGM